MTQISFSAEVDPINFDWRFAKGSHPESIQPEFNDTEWQAVDLPHDWAISGPFGKLKALGGGGKLPWQGEGYYRKQFELAAKDKGKRLQFIFDGVMASPKVYLNGHKVGSWIYGYNSFSVDATEAAKFGDNNVLTVHADTRKHNSRWYPGAGIYRKVTMRLVDPLHIPVWGVFVTTPLVKKDSAEVKIQIEVQNSTEKNQSVKVETTILNPNGKDVAKKNKIQSIAAGENASVTLDTSLLRPLMWDIKTPQLYTAVTRIFLDGKEIQSEKTTFGIRTFKWTADDGFHLNGRRVQLYGVNLHHGHGPLGAAFFPRAMERQLQIMKDMGVNAIRTSHNPSAPELLELCDRMGFVVWDELYDKYGKTAGVHCNDDTYVNEYAEREVKNFIVRDRNHPCVVIWSIGNEIKGLKEWHVDKMVAYFKKYDTTRPITLGSHIPNQGHTVINSLDASGWNYAQKYMTARKAHPEKPLIYSESASAFGTRGAYKLNLPKSKKDWGHDSELNAYVLTAASWADIPEHEFDRMLKHDFVAGEFVWTGFDYLGEPTPVDNARSSYFGIVDLAGLPKDTYYLYRSHWMPESNTVFLAPHWNWEKGDNVPVIVYTNGDEAELFLNGKSLGRKKKAKSGDLSFANLGFGKVAEASSSEHKQDAGGNVLVENLAGKAVDGNADTRWCASDGRYPQNWQVDLEKIKSISKVIIHWGKRSNSYKFDLLTSLDGKTWSTVNAKKTNKGNTSDLVFEKQKVRWVKIDIKSGGENWASIYEVCILEKDTGKNIETNPYFKTVDTYRIRWQDVPYQPGELKTVAYKDGNRIGEAIVNTAGKAAQLKLTPDCKVLKADGMDLCYITIEMLDKGGNVCPRAMNNLTFSVDGAAKLIGVANGNQMGHDSFTDSQHPLFYGKAVAVIRSMPGKSGSVRIKVSAGNDLQTKLTMDVSGR